MGSANSVGDHKVTFAEATEAAGHDLVNTILAQQWEEVTRMLKCGENIDLTVRDPEMNGTALIWAAALKHLATVQKLLDLRADPNLQTTDGRSCMHTAAIGDQIEMLELMNQAGCNLELATEDGLTALMAACQYGCVGAVSALLDLGAEKEAAANDCRSPLHCACSEGSVKVVQTLLDRGCEPNFTNSGGGTPLHVTCMNGHVEIAQELLKSGIVKEQHSASLTLQTKAGMTPFHVAAMYGHSQLVVELIKYGSNVNDVMRTDGRTALHLACKKSRAKTIVELVKSGASWDVEDRQGNTPLAYSTTTLLQDLWQQYKIKEAKKYSESGKKVEMRILPGASLPTAYTEFDKGLQRSPKMESRSPMSRSRRLGDGGPVAAAGCMHRLGDEKKRCTRKNSPTPGSFAEQKKTDRIRRKAIMDNNQSGANGTSSRTGSTVFSDSKWSPQQMRRRLNVKFNLPPKYTRN